MFRQAAKVLCQYCHIYSFPSQRNIKIKSTKSSAKPLLSPCRCCKCLASANRIEEEEGRLLDVKKDWAAADGVPPGRRYGRFVLPATPQTELLRPRIDLNLPPLFLCSPGNNKVNRQTPTRGKYRVSLQNLTVVASDRKLMLRRREI